MVNFLFAAAVVADKISVSIFAEKQRTIIEKNCSMPFLLFLPSHYPMKRLQGMDKRITGKVEDGWKEKNFHPGWDFC